MTDTTPAREQEALERARRQELNDLCAAVEADAVSALRYIERRHGRLEGVGWDRVFEAHDALFSKAEDYNLSSATLPDKAQSRADAGLVSRVKSILPRLEMKGVAVPQCEAGGWKLYENEAALYELKQLAVEMARYIAALSVLPRSDGGEDHCGWVETELPDPTEIERLRADIRRKNAALSEAETMLERARDKRKMFGLQHAIESVQAALKGGE